MINVLIVDDDAAKAERVAAAICLEVGESNTYVARVGSANEAIELLRQDDFDILVVDLNLPLRGSERPVKDGGVRLLKQVGRGTAGIRRPAYIIGLTSYEELSADAAAEFQKHGWALLTYSAESTGWEEALVNQCVHVTQWKTKHSGEGEGDRTDLCIITALSEVELEAVLDLPGGFETEVIGENRYSVGAFGSGTCKVSVVACAAPEVGNAAAAMLATKVLLRFRPRVLIMAGICAGIDAEVGEIVVAEFALHYESGKWTEGGGGEAVFKPEPRYQAGNGDIIEAVRRYKIDNKSDIMALGVGWRGKKPDRVPEIVIGPVASGAAVIENGTIVKNLSFRDRKLAGLEMESYGVYVGARHSPVRDVKYVVIKGVCDKATPPKTDDYQAYAAHICAQFIHKFVIAEAAIKGGLFCEK